MEKKGGDFINKKVFIGLFMLSVLSCNSNKAIAIDQVVIAQAPSDVWYENIFLMVDKIEGNWMAHKNFTVQVGLPSGELLYHFPNWYNDKFTPELFYKDINADSLKDIIVVLVAGSGSGLSMKEIHVLNQIHDPNRRYEEVPVESINAAVKRMVKMERHGNIATILIGNKKYKVDIAKFKYLPGTFYDQPGVGSVEQYWTEKGILYGSTVVYITPAGQIGSLKIKYDWDGKKYKSNSVSFDGAEPTDYHNDGFPDSF